MRLEITAKVYIDVDENDKETWRPEDGTPVQQTLEQLETGEVTIDELADAATLDDIGTPNFVQYTVVEVVDAG